MVPPACQSPERGEKCIDARRAIAAGISPAIEKQREKRRLKEAKSFGEFGEKWLTAAPMADSTRAIRSSSVNFCRRGAAAVPPRFRLGMRLYLLTMVRKSELQDAVWAEVDFENAVWTIPKERMKRSKAA